MHINVAMTWVMFKLQSVCIQKVLLWILRHFSFIKVLIKMIPQERQKVIIINEQQTDTPPFNSLAPLCPFKNAIIMWGGKTDTSNGCISEIIQLIASWSHLVFRCRGSWVVLWWRNVCMYERDQERSHCLNYTPDLHLHIPTYLIHSCITEIPDVAFNISNCSLSTCHAIKNIKKY